LSGSRIVDLKAWRAAGPLAPACAILALLLPILYTIVSLFVLPAMYSDCSSGFEVWDSMQRGTPFNYGLFVDPANIALDRTEFLAFWTPGQYVLPGLLERLGLSLGQAIVVVDGAFTLGGLVGWLVLYRAFGFSLRAAAIAAAIVACARHAGLPFGYYNGGEVLMFGAGPWFLLLVWRLRDFPWYSVPLLLAGGLAIVFLKLTGVLVMGSAVGAAALARDGIWPVTAGTIRKGLLAGLTLVLFALLFYVLWFSKGVTPASDFSQLHWDKLLPNAAFSAVAIWGASLSLRDLAAFLLINPAHPVLESLEALGYAMLPLALATFALVVRQLGNSHREYLRFVFWMGLAYSAILLVSWVRGGSISEYDDRHFKMISLALLPAIVESFTSARPWAVRSCFWAVAAAMSLYGVASFAQHARQNLHYPLGDRGFRQQNSSQAVIDLIHSIDRAPDAASTLIYLPTKEMALEMRRARFIAVQADFSSLEELAAPKFRGRVPFLQVLVPSRFIDNGKAEVILRSFVDYPPDGWTKSQLGDFTLFVARR
jgi:hypothetical protein